jgi:MIP family channel proteins
MAKTEAMRRNGMVSFSFHAPATSVKAELAHADTRRALIGEFLGSLLFVILGAGTVILTGGMLGERLGSSRLLVVALAQGLAYLLLVAAMLPVSGGHLNPAVTFAMMLARKINPTRGGMYIVSQCLGAMAGALMLTLIIPHGTQGNLGGHGLGAGVSIAGGLTAEVVVTFMLVSAFLHATMGGARPATLGMAAIGLTSVLGYLFAMPLTGASMNPARSLGPAFVTGAWREHWIFWAGPLIGALLAAVAHHSMARRNGRH